ncbi:hypothetical protein U8335_25250 [Roseiconus lacunae]|uniref:hypothetical protein n=1 Tax=Roseiconus lacunae TaxID=2605694 RepID=UPI001E396657|nr:hypothetical protein [Roseiconus lacunae]MCD0457938.1 hypothetical protein [Roseiconus lacunae]WRQ50247.1 hypothetical protein U8335_25250 [Stieleria sp. HD01]
MESLIRNFCQHRPWKPFEFQTSQGEWIRIESPDIVLPAFDELIVLDTKARRTRMFSMLHIVEARHLEFAVN